VLERRPDVAAVFGLRFATAPAEFHVTHKNCPTPCVTNSGQTPLGGTRRMDEVQGSGRSTALPAPPAEDIELDTGFGGGLSAAARSRFEDSPEEMDRQEQYCQIDITAQGILDATIHRYGAGERSEYATRASLVWCWRICSYCFAGVGVLAVGRTRRGRCCSCSSCSAAVLPSPVQRRGWLSAGRAGAILSPCNGVSFLAGTIMHFASRVGIRLPGALHDVVASR
jgi:hypothetical protein